MASQTLLTVQLLSTDLSVDKKGVHMNFKMIRTAAAAITVAALSGAVMAQSVTGAGASFPAPLYSKWASAYATETGVRINYQSVGSGAGLRQIRGKVVDFGASDMPLKDDELAKDGLMQFPTVIGGVVPVVNIKGIQPGQLRLTGEVLGDIYLGKITKWNDPAIAALNPGLALPDLRITVVHRSDGSGTTFNFVNYLSKVSPEWKTKVGEGTSVQWPTGVGGKGNEGVAAYVKQIKGGIGYVELSYALQNKMAYASLKNASGNFVQPSDETFAAAAASAEWGKSKDFYLVMTNAPGANSWPITATNFILMYKAPKKGNKDARDFFRWVYANGDAQAKSLDYVPLPPELVAEWQQHLAESSSLA